MSTTPNRQTVVTIDEKRVFKAEPELARGYIGREIAPDGAKESQHVEYLPNVGWQVATYESRSEFKHESGVADASVLTPSNGNVQVAPRLFEKPLQRAYTELPGVTLGTGQRTSGDLYLRKDVASGGSFDSGITADAASFPGPTESDAFLPLDRMLCGTSLMEPDDGIAVVIQTPDMNGSQRIGTIGRIYFGAIGGSNTKEPPNGVGQYCLSLKGSGIALLWEKLDTNGWEQRQYLRWAPDGQVMGATHSITIKSDAHKVDGKWIGSRILFKFGSNPNTVKGLLNALTTVFDGEWHEYTVPQAAESTYQPCPVRMDLRRDFRGWIQASNHTYYPTGVLIGPMVPLEQPATGSTPLSVQWAGAMPAGTTVVISLVDQDGSSIGAGAGDSGPTAGYRLFVLPAGTRAVRPTLTLSSASGKTPNIEEIRLIRAARIETIVETPVELPTVTTVSLTDGGSDPSHETLSLVCQDRYNQVPQLGIRSLMPVHVSIRIDPADPTLKVRVFRGAIVDSIQRRPTGKQTKGRTVVGDSIWRAYALRGMGEWHKLSRRVTKQRINLLRDPKESAEQSKKIGYKVTDIIRGLLLDEYPPEMVDVPDLEIRFLGDDRIPTFLEPFSEFAGLIMKLCREYLGGWLVFDTAAGEAGVWRVKIPPKPAPGGIYRWVCEFVLGPGEGDVPGTLNPGGYVRGGDGEHSWSRIPCRKGPYHHQVIPLEGNYIVVQGVGVSKTGGALMAVEGRNLLQQELRNFVSAEFFEGQPIAPDPDHPDYVGDVYPIYYADPGLTTQAAVDLTCRRLYDLCAHTRYRKNIEAAMIFIEDEKDGHLRKPMYGDPCLFEGQNYYIVECNFETVRARGGDGQQLVSYVIESVPGIGDYSAIANRID